MSLNQRFPVWLPAATFAFAALHLAFEYFADGVKSHHLLNQPDLPVVSNWLGLVTLPFLGFILGLRVRSHVSEERLAGFPRPVLVAFCGALLYGVVLASSFEFGATTVTSVASIGIFASALVLPVYRAEYVTGFVMGMTVTFGGVLPFIFAMIVAALSFVVRYIVRSASALVRRRR